jgi:hypothetical protein
MSGRQRNGLVYASNAVQRSYARNVRRHTLTWALEPAEAMRGAIREVIASIEPFDAFENADRTDALDWIDSGAQLFRTQKPATPPKHHLAHLSESAGITNGS